jgi:hypothetical protein
MPDVLKLSFRSLYLVNEPGQENRQSPAIATVQLSLSSHDNSADILELIRRVVLFVLFVRLEWDESFHG